MNPGTTLEDWVNGLAARGIHHFRTDEAEVALAVSRSAARAALRRLKQKKRIATPFRGFQVILPPEYQSLGCLPAEQFVPQLFAWLQIPYYFGLLSAAAFYGAAHQQPQVAQVVVPKNRPPIECGRVKVEFIARNNLVEMPTRDFNTPRGRVRVSNPEATAFDLVGRPERSGGLDHVTTVLAELAEDLESQQLVALSYLSPLPWSQRLGYLLDFLGFTEKATALAQFICREAHETVPLAPGGKAQGTRNARWQVLVNTEVATDL